MSRMKKTILKMLTKRRNEDEVFSFLQNNFIDELIYDFTKIKTKYNFNNFQDEND